MLGSFEKAKNLSMANIIGNRELCDRFCHDIREGKLSHAYIIDGKRGTGKFTFAMEIAAAICCENSSLSDTPLPCGTCKSCRRVFDFLTPDIAVIKPENGKVSISKEQIKEMRAKVCFSPTEMPMRIFIIKDAHTMTAEAQNAFLLTLEEPPEYVLFLLLTDNSSALLETVRSRAPTVRLKPLDDATMEDYLLKTSDAARSLRAKDAGEWSRIIVNADGSIGRALELLNPAENEQLHRLNEITDEFITVVSGVKNSDGGYFKLISLFENTYFKDREGVGIFLNSAITALRDLLLSRRSDKVKLCYFTDAEAVSELATKFTVANLLRYIELCENARISVTVKNSNIRLTMLRLATNIFLSDAN